MTEIDGRSLIAPHPDHPDAECLTCGAPATEWAYPLCTACLIQYSELAAEGEIEQGIAMIRKRDKRIEELEAALDATIEDRDWHSEQLDQRDERVAKLEAQRDSWKANALEWKTAALVRFDRIEELEAAIDKAHKAMRHGEVAVADEILRAHVREEQDDDGD